MTSYLFATGDDAIYSFPSYTSMLPKCQWVISYKISYVSPSTTGLSYPSLTCSTDPCRSIDIDVSAVNEIYFKIDFDTIIDAGSTVSTGTIQIKVEKTQQSPMITAPTLVE